MTLDIRTILFSQTLMGILSTVVMLLLRKSAGKGARGIGWWTVSFAGITAGQLLISLRGVIPYVLTMVPANLLLAGGLVSLYYGTCSFFGVSARRSYGIATIIAVAINHTIFGHLRIWLPPRLVIFAVIGIATSGLCIWVLMRYAEAEIRRNARAVALLYGIYICVYLARIYGAVVFQVGSDFLTSNPWEAANLLATTVIHTALAFTMIELVDARLRAQVERNAEEKTLLMREMHHRTKNDFALVESLISLESGPVGGNAASEALERVRGRVHSFSILHDRLYRGAATGSVDAGEYLELIAAGLLEGGAEKGRVRLERAVERLEVEAGTAVALGLIANELITNALKHAFPGGRPGTISLGLRRHEGSIILEVADDGAGYAPEDREKGPAGLGTVLVDSLAKQLGGSVQRTQGPAGGVRVEVIVAPKQTPKTKAPAR